MTPTSLRAALVTAVARTAFRRRQIGLGIGADAIRVVGVERGAIQWATESPRANPALSEDISALLDNVPRTWMRSPRARVVAAIGPWHVCTKRLKGFPRVADPRMARELVREGASRFFLTLPGPVLTTVGPLDSADPWAAAFDRSVVEAVALACETSGFQLAAALPAVTVLGRAVGADALEWTDGDCRVRLRFERGVLVAVSRAPSEDTLDEAIPLSGLSALGEDALRFADAYAAAVSGPESWELRAPTGGLNAAQASRARLRGRVAVGCCAIALLASLLAPGLAANASSARARAELVAIAPQRVEVARLREGLRQVTAGLAEVSALSDRRRSNLELLAALTAVVPEQSAITTLRTDSTTGTIVVLALRAADVVSRLDSLSVILTPEIVGPVTRETLGGRELERVTIRFALGGRGGRSQ